jgi:CelD/BcsL family acetyltransferase involved in cellulose biosynthesis
MTYSTRIIRSEAEFGELRLRWNALASDCRSANTFLTHDWLFTWWTAYRPEARLAIVLAENRGELVGIAPMMLMRQGGLGRLFRRLRFIGDGTSETDHMNFIVSPVDGDGVLSAMLAVIDALPWDIAHFNQLPESSPNTALLLRHASRHGWLLNCSQIPCPLRALPESYDALLKSLPSRLRTSLRAARRELSARYSVEFGHVTRRDELSIALETLYRNHAGRWQARGEGGVFVNPRKRDFYAALAERLLETGALRFFYLRLDGKTVAQQFCFDHGGTVMLLQEGFDFEFAKMNVGNVLRAMVFEWLIENGARSYDFLAGTSRHKQSWSDSTPNDLEIRACRPTVVGRAAFSLPRLLRQLKAQPPARPAALVE